MYKSRSSIDEWLSQRDNPTQTRKRRRDDSEAEADADVGDKYSDLPSPPITLCPADPTTTNSPPMQDSAAPCTTPVRAGKRRKEADGYGVGGGSDQDEDDPTPRRLEDMPGWGVARSVESQSSTQSESQSTGSQTSSVKRRRRTHGLGLVAVGAPQLAYFGDDSHRPPPLLHDLAIQLEDLGADRHFVWPELRDDIIRHQLKDSLLFRSLAKPVWYAEPGLGPSSLSLGPSPSCAQLQQLVQAARECETEHDSEAHWNCAVHYPVLALALESHPRLRAMCCTSATINTEYQALQGPPPSSIRGDAKKVDFCIAIRQSGPDRHPAIADINTSESVNHSNHPSLLSNPIAISIETKAASPNQEEAELQMGVWMTAHLARLRALLVRQYDRRPGLSSHQSNRVPSSDTIWRQAMEDLGFLPGIVVLQHEWYFIAATWAPPLSLLGDSGNHGGSGVTLWRRIAIGSTATPEGICHIIYVVRRLAVWAETMYWPWFRRWALGDNSPPAHQPSADT